MEIKHPVASEITYLAQNKPIIRFSENKPIIRPRPPASGISLKKAAPPAPFGDCLFYNHVLQGHMYSHCLPPQQVPVKS
jgi:hypothetical protein